MRSLMPGRWVAITIFVFSSVLNYLDRQVLATMVDIWRTQPEFPFTYDDYGLLLSVFSLAYALSALFVGWFIDRVGLNRGACIAVAVWAAASIGTGMSHSVHELLFWRALLGMAEASGVSAVAKAVGMYLLPKERAVGSAMSQLGLSLAWIPVWLLTSRLIPPAVEPKRDAGAGSFSLLKDPKLWALIIANALGMTVYSLWTNWPPTYLIRTHHLTPPQAANYTWIVPISGYFGAMLGGFFSWRLIRNGMSPVAARKRACLISACFLLGTMAIPLLPTPALATAGMSLSYFWVCAWSTNHYTLPIDIYGADRAAFGVGALIFAYGTMQTIVSRPVAQIIEKYGFQPICFVFSLLPIASYLLVHLLIRDDAGVEMPEAVEAPV